ncbi:MAG TPA: peptidylprolyl isomerase [Burkholderiaceae bacterium]|jgi:peptidyl-prolyl cis-trans isomerase C|nr:peptidylprolyl isomerase [Burkholderiaceae bacterium]
MTISVNGVEITDYAIEQELRHHRKVDNPLKQTVHELVLRTLLLQAADRLGIEGDDEDARIETLLEQEIHVPEADEATCEMFYRNQPERFSSGEMVEARHILFQVTPTVPLELLRETGEAVLAELRNNPERFVELARQYSNCPSGAVGGNLGQLTRGQTVPEFETFVFRLAEGELGGRLLETRFGLHIVQVLRRIEGKRLPFDAVKSQIADNLTRQSWRRGVHQYLQILVGQADIKGITLEGTDNPLVQ